MEGFRESRRPSLHVFSFVLEWTEPISSVSMENVPPVENGYCLIVNLAIGSQDFGKEAKPLDSTRSNCKICAVSSTSAGKEKRFINFEPDEVGEVEESQLEIISGTR